MNTSSVLGMGRVGPSPRGCPCQQAGTLRMGLGTSLLSCQGCSVLQVIMFSRTPPCLCKHFCSSQMLYYVKDVPATIRYFHSLLEGQAKLLIIVVSGESCSTTYWVRREPRAPLGSLRVQHRLARKQRVFLF